MSIQARCYEPGAGPGSDYERVLDFLVDTYRESGSHVNWLSPRWEYMHHHALVQNVDLSTIGIWEADGRVVGVVHPEHSTGTVYLELDAARPYLAEEMLSYAEEHLSLPSSQSRQTQGPQRPQGARAPAALRVFINDAHDSLQRIAELRGYQKDGGSEAMSRFDIPEAATALGAPELPAGFRLTSLADEDDPAKVHRLLWRGFGHEGEPPPEGVAERALMASASGFRADLNVVAIAPDETFAAYCGMWHEPKHGIAYVEPVATDPRFRRLGLGRAVVLEGIRRCGLEGAIVAYVGTEMPFYLTFGFRRVHRLSVWRRTW
jgi:predicted N-acetyltransferase YhbS